MPFYLIQLRRTVEIGGVYEADTADEAVGLAQMEANHNAEIIDEDVIADEVEALDAREREVN